MSLSGALAEVHVGFNRGIKLLIKLDIPGLLMGKMIHIIITVSDEPEHGA